MSPNDFGARGINFANLVQLIYRKAGLKIFGKNFLGVYRTVRSRYPQAENGVHELWSTNQKVLFRAVLSNAIWFVKLPGAEFHFLIVSSVGLSAPGSLTLGSALNF